MGVQTLSSEPQRDTRSRKACFIEMLQHCFHDADSVGLARGGAVDFHLSRLFTVDTKPGPPLSSRGAGLLLISSLYTDSINVGGKRKERREEGRQGERKEGGNE